MKRATGEYLAQTVAGEPYRAYLPAPLPPDPPLVLDAELLRLEPRSEAGRFKASIDFGGDVAAAAAGVGCSRVVEETTATLEHAEDVSVEFAAV